MYQKKKKKAQCLPLRNAMKTSKGGAVNDWKELKDIWRYWSKLASYFFKLRSCRNVDDIKGSSSVLLDVMTAFCVHFLQFWSVSPEFLASALATFGARWFSLLQDCPVHCRTRSSIPPLSLQDAKRNSRRPQPWKPTLAEPHVPRGQNCTW